MSAFICSDGEKVGATSCLGEVFQCSRPVGHNRILVIDKKAVLSFYLGFLQFRLKQTVEGM